MHIEYVNSTAINFVIRTVLIVTNLSFWSSIAPIEGIDITLASAEVNPEMKVVYFVNSLLWQDNIYWLYIPINAWRKIELFDKIATSKIIPISQVREENTKKKCIIYSRKVLLYGSAVLPRSLGRLRTIIKKIITSNKSPRIIILHKGVLCAL